MTPIDRIEQPRADLARATAELEHHKSVKETIDSAHKELSREHAALRARTAELEKDRDDWKKCADLAERALASEQQRSAELEAKIERDAWAISPAMAQARINMLASELGQVKQRNADLVAALREVDEIVNDANHSAEDRLCAAANRLLNTSAESATPDHIPDAAKMVSATPAKHPDTVRLDWLESAPSERLAEVRRVLWQQHNTCMATRSAIDAARKQEASK